MVISLYHATISPFYILFSAFFSILSMLLGTIQRALTAIAYNTTRSAGVYAAALKE
jgi:hypothetical protein